MSTRFNERTLVGHLMNVCGVGQPAPPPERIYEVGLVSGKVIIGELSPFTDDSEYIRLNEGRSGPTLVPLRHIEFVRPVQK